MHIAHTHVDRLSVVMSLTKPACKIETLKTTCVLLLFASDDTVVVRFIHLAFACFAQTA